MSRFITFSSNRPDVAARVFKTLSHSLRYERRDNTPIGWGVGFEQFGELLLRRRPTDERDVIDLLPVLEKIQSNLIVAHIRSATRGALRTENTHPFRCRDWLFAAKGTIGVGRHNPNSEPPKPIAETDEEIGEGDGQLNASSVSDEVKETSRRFSEPPLILGPDEKALLLKNIPEHLLRNYRGDTDSELLFYFLLGSLESHHLLDSHNCQEIQDCLASAVQFLRDESGLDGAPNIDWVLAKDGQMHILAQSSQLYELSLDGSAIEQLFADDDLLSSELTKIASSHARLVLASNSPPSEANWRQLNEPLLLAFDKSGSRHEKNLR